jgi:hypothetical protein
MKKLLVLLLLQVSFVVSYAQTIQAESLTLGGPYAGKITAPFSGAAFYGNGDKGDGSITLTNATGQYNVTVAGASSNTSVAQIDLFIDGTKVGTFSFSGTTASNATKAITISTGTAGKTIQLLLSTDNGSLMLIIFLSPIRDRYLLLEQRRYFLQHPLLNQTCIATCLLKRENLLLT